MTHEAKKILHSIELRTGGRIAWLCYREQSDPIGHVRIEVYPKHGDDYTRTFNLTCAITPSEEEAIREWFEPLAKAT